MYTPSYSRPSSNSRQSYNDASARRMATNASRTNASRTNASRINTSRISNTRTAAPRWMGEVLADIIVVEADFTVVEADFTVVEEAMEDNLFKYVTKYYKSGI